MNPNHVTTDKGDILYDADYLGHQPDETFFDPAYWARMNAVRKQAPGRGTTVLVEHEGQGLALRHYHRGGLPAMFSRDSYLWTGLSRSRPWQEWHLLAQLYKQGLPVPRPVAARVGRSGLFYRGDLMTAVIPGEPLADILCQRQLPSKTFVAIGACLRRFHNTGVYHADLNARNILLGEGSEVSLIDFDRGELRRPADSWQQANLSRLRRSLDKFQHQQTGFHFTEDDWDSLLRGYSDSGAQ